MWPNVYPGYRIPYELNKNILLSEEIKRLAIYSTKLEEEIGIIRKDNTVLTGVIDERDGEISGLKQLLHERDNGIIELNSTIT